MSQDDKREPTTGTVTRWHDIDGLGVITSEDVPGEVWVHFSHIVTKPPRNLTVGQSVRFTWEEFPQDEHGAPGPRPGDSIGNHHHKCINVQKVSFGQWMC
ncbi:cold-shock protein [Microbispora sp. CA-135349]|uniref:cold-shock protein n=1 Tax=Microbispora sp. CA-135349 TaxID=3239953 RepID=UPI003D91DF2D